MVRILLTIVLMAACLWSPLRAVGEPQGGSNLGSVRGGDFTAAQAIIGKKCTKCHSGKRIDAALSANKDMARIQREMERKGAELSANERKVLGVYWKQNPLKQK